MWVVYLVFKVMVLKGVVNVMWIVRCNSFGVELRCCCYVLLGAWRVLLFV
jgi:hypothetical protein